MKNIRQLICSMLKIGTIGFGGGNALIPIIEQEVVVNKKMITKEEYDSIVTMGNITPGAMVIKVAAGIGQIIAGTKGMFLAAAAVSLPGAFILILLLSGMSLVGTEVLGQIQLLFIGIATFIVYTLTKYIFNNINSTHNNGKMWLTIGIIGIVFVLNNFISTLVILVVSYIVLILCGMIKCKNDSREVRNFQTRRFVIDTAVLLFVLIAISIPALVIVPGFINYIINGLISCFVSFGGGSAYLTAAEGFFVETGMISEGDFYGSIVTTVNILPGSTLGKMLSGVGYYVGLGQGGIETGIIAAWSGFCCGLSGSCIVVLFAQNMFFKFVGRNTFVLLKRWIRIVVSGLMGSVIIGLFSQCLGVAVQYNCPRMLVVIEMLIIYLINVCLDMKFKNNMWFCVVISSIVALCMGNIIM